MGVQDTMRVEHARMGVQDKSPCTSPPFNNHLPNAVTDPYFSPDLDRKYLLIVRGLQPLIGRILLGNLMEDLACDTSTRRRIWPRRARTCTGPRP